MPKQKPDPEKKICDAALRLAATQDWNDLTLEQIAKAAKVPRVQAKKLFADKDAILPALIRRTGREVAAAVGGPARALTHDRLFEVMMARFDILQSHRAAILGIINAVRRNPALARAIVPAEAQAMRAMLVLAGFKGTGIEEIFAAAGLLAIYALALCRWARDDSPDMAKTMALLDRSLRRGGKLAELLFPHK